MTTTEQTTEVLTGDLATPVEVIGSGPSVLYLRSEEAWNDDPLPALLAESFQVFSPNLCPTEESLSQVDGFLDLLSYLNDILDALDLASVSVVGHSWGGMIGAELAAMNPERVDRLVLLAPLGLWHKDDPVSDLHAMPPGILVERLYGTADRPEATAWLAGVGGPNRMRAMRSALHFCFPIAERGLIKRLHRVKSPTLLVWGERDGIVPLSYAETFKAEIPTAEVRTIANAAHLYGEDDAPECASIVKDFLEA